mgnify:FL=1|jgi:hypothetical protein
MANTYTYSVASLKKTDEVYPSVIKSAVINVVASDGTNQVNDQIEVIFGEIIGGPSIEFIDYTDLTEQNIIDWAANDPILLTMPSQLDKKLIGLSQDSVDSNFPWS